MPYVSSLTLTAFRNYESATIAGLKSGFIVLTGENGAGKTNCLEAVSLLTPGRGLRGAGVPECRMQGQAVPWSVTADIADDEDPEPLRLGVGQDLGRPDKKIIRLNGEPVRTQAALGETVRAIWLTPQMDGLFLQSAGERRRFFDRLAASWDPAHTGRMTRYEKATRERLSLLRRVAETGTAADPAWLAGIESVMAETGVAIAAVRLAFLERLEGFIGAGDDDGDPSLFPPLVPALNGPVETVLANAKSALEAEDESRRRLAGMRAADGAAGQTSWGVHKTAFTARHKIKGQDAALCSTGEQKAMLTGLILAHARMIAARRDAPPLLLFDEVAAHFDAVRRDALFDRLSALKTQVWLTGQDRTAFAAIASCARLVTVRDNGLS